MHIINFWKLRKHRYHESPSLSARKPEKVIGLLTVGPTLNCHYNIGIRESVVTYDTAISIGVSHEWAPVFEMLWLIGRQRHLSDVGDHVFV